MKKYINVAIAGATGYIGVELIKLLVKHPRVKIKNICAQGSVGESINKFDPLLKKEMLPKITNLNTVNFDNIDILFTALPNGEAQKVSKKLNPKVKLIDLSADFRLESPKNYKKWYDITHKSKNLIKHSIYSIPELINVKLNKFRIIACPGCYPTSIQIPLVPIIKNKLINTKNIIIDSKSGYSGAGKNLHKKFKFKNIYESISAYGVGSHKHMAEIDQQLKKISKNKVNVQFTPHLSPMFRGILSTIYVNLNKNISVKKIYNFLKKYYKNKYFVKFAKFNTPIGTGDIINTNFCKISVCYDRKRNKAIILSTIDNLIKGGSGQAMQNMNLLCGFNEQLGFK
jgi:N-acetyl-gamma-glutamyl-phosphate reductase|tara:strand:- start:171 stop:1196 length:1026 start_codon:yes stop_codon:yes gene_type:complete